MNIIKILGVTMCCLLLAGCGKVLNQKQLLDYANEHYGDSIIVSEMSSDESEKLYLQDKEYEFEYYVVSKMSDIIIDGSSFGTQPIEESNFNKKYIECFTEKYKNQIEDIQTQYNCTIEISKNYTDDMMETLINISTNDENYKEAAKELNKYIKEYDTRNFFEKGKITLTQNEKFVGIYMIKEDKFRNADEVDTEQALYNAWSIMKYDKDVNINSAEDLTFLYSETMDIDKVYETFGLGNGTLEQNITDSSESLESATVWHYSFENEEWIVTSCFVGPYGNWYVKKIG